MNMKELNKKIEDLYLKSIYLRNFSYLCDTQEQTNRIRAEQDKYYKEWVFLTNLRDEMNRKENKKR